MEIWLVKDERIRLPITPYFEINSSNNNSTENLNEIGTINLAGKPGLRSCSISSFFPSKEGPYIESGDTNLNPYYYSEKIYKWSRETEPIRLIITETPYNFEVLIDSYKAGETDGSGDVYYTLELSEYVRVESTEYKPPKKNIPNMKNIPRYAGMAQIPAALLTVGKYDTAWTMAKKMFGNGELGGQLLKDLGIKKLSTGMVLNKNSKFKKLLKGDKK